MLAVETPERAEQTPSDSRSSAASPTVRAIGPMWSSRLSRTKPAVGTESKVGLMPTTPQSAAGTRIEPPVSVPSEPKHRQAATAAADPLDEPPVARLGSWGFRVGGQRSF